MKFRRGGYSVPVKRTAKFSLGVPHYRLEQHLADRDVELGRGTMCRYVE